MIPQSERAALARLPLWLNPKRKHRKESNRYV
jgi:hypothetical protein